MQFKNNEQLGMSNQDTQNFLKLKDKESVVGVFRGSPFDFRQHWIANRSFPCKGQGCEHCTNKVKSTFRFRLNFVTKDPNNPQGYVAKIFEQGFSVYESLRALGEAGHNLERTLVKITRNGTGQATSYTIVNMPQPLAPQSEQFISKVKLHDLTNFSDSNEQSQMGGSTPDPWGNNANMNNMGNAPAWHNEDIPF